MGLRLKVFLMVSCFVLVFLSGVFWFVRDQTAKQFLGAQKDDAETQIGIASGIFERDMRKFSVSSTDWSQWDDTYDFIETRDTRYVDSNLNDESFEGLGSNIVLILNTEGDIVFEKQVLPGSAGTDIPGPILKTLSQNGELRTFQSETDSHFGLLVFDTQIIEVVSRPVVRSDGSGPIRGALFFARYITQSDLDEIGSVTHVHITLLPRAVAEANAEYRTILETLTHENTSAFSMDSQQNVSIARWFSDIFGEPVFLFKVSYQGHIVERGLQNVRLFEIAGLILSIFFVILIFLLEEGLVLRKLLRLEAEVNRVTALKDTNARVTVDGKDEFALLGNDINGMLVALKESVEQTKQVENRFEIIANLAPVMIWMMNESGEYVYLNQNAQAFIRTVAGKDLWEEGVFLEDKGMRRSLIKEARAAKRAFRLEYRFQNTKGGYIWVSESAVPYLGVSGEQVGYIGVVINIHEEKEVKLQAKAFTQEVEEMNMMLIAREEKMLELKEEIKRLKEHKKAADTDQQ